MNEKRQLPNLKSLDSLNIFSTTPILGILVLCFNSIMCPDSMTSTILTLWLYKSKNYNSYLKLFKKNVLANGLSVVAKQWWSPVISTATLTLTEFISRVGLIVLSFFGSFISSLEISLSSTESRGQIGVSSKLWKNVQWERFGENLLFSSIFSSSTFWVSLKSIENSWSKSSDSECFTFRLGSGDIDCPDLLVGEGWVFGKDLGSISDSYLLAESFLVGSSTTSRLGELGVIAEGDDSGAAKFSSASSSSIINASFFFFFFFVFGLGWGCFATSSSFGLFYTQVSKINHLP